jgi:hypothetical protein
MKQSRIMSRTQKTISTPFLPIEVWFVSWPLVRWSLIENENDDIFEFQFLDKPPEKVKTFRGTDYVNGMLAISKAQQLVKFMNHYACPISFEDSIATPYPLSDFVEWKPKDSITGQPPTASQTRLNSQLSKVRKTVELAPFPWSAFVETQAKLKQAMGLSISELLRRTEFAPFFRLEKLTVTAERRQGAYYGILKTSPSLESCYRVIAFERLLANVQYGFCERCGIPFQVTSKHKRKYCETDGCGHAVAQQKYRDKKRNNPV